MNARATKNMWVVRCSHIGAMIGGLLSIAFGGAWLVIKWIFSNLLYLILTLATLFMGAGLCATIYFSYKDAKIATPDMVKELLATSDQRACLKNYFPVYTADKTKNDPGFILKVEHLNRMVLECEKAEQAEGNKKILAEQLKAAK